MFQTPPTEPCYNWPPDYPQHQFLDEIALRNPYGQVGDRLWVKETWRINHVATDYLTVYYRAHEQHSHTEMCEKIPVAGLPEVQAGVGWRPSTTMPRWASRYDLEIAEVWIAEMTDEEAQEEGCAGVECKHRGTAVPPSREYEEKHGGNLVWCIRVSLPPLPRFASYLYHL